MSYLETQDDREPTESELEWISKLSPEQVAGTDDAILLNAGRKYKKVAMIVAIVKTTGPKSMIHLPDVYFTRRVAHLVSTGHLEARLGIELPLLFYMKDGIMSDCKFKKGKLDEHNKYRERTTLTKPWNMAAPQPKTLSIAAEYGVIPHKVNVYEIDPKSN